MKRRLELVAVCVAFTSVLGACGGGDEGSEGAASGLSSSKNAAVKGAALKVMNSRYGRMLFDANGRALYLFTRDRTSRSRCYGDCASAWPPFLAKGKPQGRGGVKAGLLGTTARRGGKTQITYRGHPLYYYVGDRKPGQVLCQDVAEFGGTWLIVSPSGRAIR
jgi:predicted lipoprotein with Yx(FWY)xxD motif